MATDDRTAVHPVLDERRGVGITVSNAGALGRLGKRLAPPLARFSAGPRRSSVLQLVETYLSIIQGKGSGTGWDLDGEGVAAERFLRGIPAPVVLDVGANVGHWSSSLHAALRNADARYLLVEPQQACRDRLANLHLPGVEVIDVGISDMAGTATLLADVAGSGAASLYVRSESYFGDMTAYQEQVEVCTIDQLLEWRSVDRIDLMKLDIEGAELSALNGASDALQAERIRTIAFEFGSANIYSRTFFRDVWDVLTAAGFRLWRVVPGGFLSSIPEYSEHLEHFRGVSNYLASLDSPLTY